MWACRKYPKGETNYIPFRLTFGNDAVLPVEIYLQSSGIQRQTKVPFDHYWNMILEELVDLDEDILASLNVLIIQKEQIAKEYNNIVKLTKFVIGDYICKFILPMDQKDRTLGK